MQLLIVATEDLENYKQLYRVYNFSSDNTQLPIIGKQAEYS